MKTERQKITLTAGDALIVVDVQNDFLPGGSLAVPCSGAVVSMLNAYLAEFAGRHVPIFLPRDWHPPDHCSFQRQGGACPVHCVADSKGAAFASALKLPSPLRRRNAPKKIQWRIGKSREGNTPGPVPWFHWIQVQRSVLPMRPSACVPGVRNGNRSPESPAPGQFLKRHMFRLWIKKKPFFAKNGGAR